MFNDVAGKMILFICSYLPILLVFLQGCRTIAAIDSNLCTLNEDKTRLTCTNHTGTDLHLKINEMVEKLEKSDLTVVTITWTTLDTLPSSICQLTSLVELDLRHNMLTTLVPRNCFSMLINLRSLRLDYNRIRGLDRGTFEGLQSLQSLIIIGNEMTFIEPGVFANKSDLLHLQYIDLQLNQLTSLDPWPLIRGQTVNGCDVNLGGNRITSFTNSLNWNFKCGMQPIDMRLDMSKNEIHHFSDILSAWNFQTNLDYFCMHGKDASGIFRLHIADNPFICDCKDYEWIKFSKYFRHADTWGEVYCSEPAEYASFSPTAIPLDGFVCDVTDGCPHKCKCTDQPHSRTMHVDCSDAGLTNLPLELPPLKLNSTYRYNLTCSKNSLQKLEYRSYLHTTRRLDVSYSGVSELEKEFWRSLQNVEGVNLEGNRLTRFPGIVAHSNSSKMALNIGGNPISCGCSERWVQPWLKSIEKSLQNPEGILCDSPAWLRGKSLLKLNIQDFCNRGPYQTGEILGMTISPIVGLVLINLVVVIVMKKFRFKLYKYVKIHPFDRDECHGEEMDYDVFLTCAHEDVRFGRDILVLLEDEGFKVCYHERDFVPGMTISQNIINSITRSKRVLCLVTRNFVRSGYCMEEFLIAHHQDLQLKRKRLVMFILESLDSFEMTGELSELENYLKRYTYIDYTNNTWVDQLMYALPINRMNPDKSAATSSRRTMSYDDKLLSDDIAQQVSLVPTNSDCLMLEI